LVPIVFSHRPPTTFAIALSVFKKSVPDLLDKQTLHI
jgi:hypothetical protein